MDLRSKRIFGLSQILMFAAILALYTRIGGLGMIYFAGSMEIFYIIVYLFMGGIPDAVEYMTRLREKREQYKDALKVRKAAVIYVILATILTEAALVGINHLLIYPSGLKYIDQMLYLLMITVPFLGILQVLRGLLQTKLDRMVTGLSHLIFTALMIVGTVISVVLIGDYGTKAAKMMQSVMLEYFYVLLGIIPGIIIGALAAIIFLIVLRIIYRDQFKKSEARPGSATENIFMLVVKLFVSQISDTLLPCVQRIPILVLLWLSVSEINNENYLFGSFYGAILPALYVAWTISDLGLYKYKKKLFIAFRKKQSEVYYRDVKTVLCYVMIHSVAIAGFALALHKSFLAIWGQQTFVPLMELAAYCAFIAFIGLPYIVFTELLKYRNMQLQALVSTILGIAAGILCGVIGCKHWGVGTLLYVLSLSVQMSVTIILSAFILSSSVGVNYISVVIRTSACIIITLVISVVLFVIEKLVFTALGGLATLILCIAIGAVLLFVVILALKIFSKEELKDLPLSFLTGFFSKIF